MGDSDATCRNCGSRDTVSVCARCSGCEGEPDVIKPGADKAHALRAVADEIAAVWHAWAVAEDPAIGSDRHALVLIGDILARYREGEKRR